MNSPSLGQTFADGIEEFKRSLYRSMVPSQEQREIRNNAEQAELLRSRASLKNLTEQLSDPKLTFGQRLERIRELDEAVRSSQLAAQRDGLSIAPELLGIRGQKLEQDDSSYQTRAGADTDNFLRKQGGQTEAVSRLTQEQRQGEIDYLRALQEGNSQFMGQVAQETAADRDFYREMSKPRIQDFLMGLVQSAAPIAVAKLAGVV